MTTDGSDKNEHIEGDAFNTDDEPFMDIDETTLDENTANEDLMLTNSSLSIKELTERMTDLAELWETIESKKLLEKEMVIKVSYPMKQVSTFTIVKQLSISWKLYDKVYSPWKLYIQMLAMVTKSSRTPKGKSELYSRIIWSKHNKYFHKMSPFLRPSLFTLVSDLGKTFGFESNDVGSITYPF